MAYITGVWVAARKNRPRSYHDGGVGPIRRLRYDAGLAPGATSALEGSLAAPIRAIRLYQSAKRRDGPFGRALSRYWALQHWFWSIVAPAEIDLSADIGGGLLSPHPNGIVIHPGVRIGPNCPIFQQVTLGVGKDSVPVVGGHVDIGAGATVLGAVRLGDHCEVGANAVVTRDVPEGMIAVGVPAVNRERSAVRRGAESSTIS